jgi:hypothetical protein
VLAVAHAGYYSATTEVYGVLHTQNDRYVWTRVRVAGGEPMKLFVANLGPVMPSVSVTRITNQSLRLDMLFVT